MTPAEIGAEMDKGDKAVRTRLKLLWLSKELPSSQCNPGRRRGGSFRESLFRVCG